MKDLQFNTDKIYNTDCIQALKQLPDDFADMTLTDIPYGEVNQNHEKWQHGCRSLDKGDADIVDFDLEELTELIIQKTKGSIYMFCGFEQFSTIMSIFKKHNFSPRCIVWNKTNPSPLGGKHNYISGIELCAFAKKPSSTFNAHCQNTVFNCTTQHSKIHPTQKPVTLFKQLILNSSNNGDTVLDPFIGSGTTAIAAISTNRHFLGFEKNKEFFNSANNRITQTLQQLLLPF